MKSERTPVPVNRVLHPLIILQEYGPGVARSCFSREAGNPGFLVKFPDF